MVHSPMFWVHWSFLLPCYLFLIISNIFFQFQILLLSSHKLRFESVSLALDNFFFYIHRSVLSYRLKGFFYRSLELSAVQFFPLQYSVLQIPVISSFLNSNPKLGKLLGSVWVSPFCTVGWKLLGDELEHLQFSSCVSLLSGIQDYAVRYLIF